MKKLSIIIPIYNTNKQLKKCLWSICNQTYTDLEIICVDDGSTDGSEQIVDEYAEKDDRIIVIHQSNVGESNARNVGLKFVTGDYITFCDCDDWIDLDMYETLVSIMEQEDLDMICASWYKETDAESMAIKNELPVSTKVFDRNQLLRYLYMRDSYRGFAYIWNKVYKADILKKKDGSILSFDESLRIGGDVLYLAQTALNANRVRYVDRSFYHYLQRNDSGCHTKDLYKLRDWLKAYEMILELFEKAEVDIETMDYVKRCLAYRSSNLTELAIEQNEYSMKILFQGIMWKYKNEYVRLNKQYPRRVERFLELLEK